MIPSRPSRAVLAASPLAFGDLFPNGRVYHVPPFQRDYSWTEDEWEDLWTDINELPQQTDFHYMGVIVVREAADGPYLLIDGQQRLATLSLLALAVITLIRELESRGVEPDNNRQRSDLLFHQFLGLKDPTSLQAVSRLQLNRADNGFYQRLINFRPPVHARGLRPSERLLWQGCQYFQDKLRASMPDASGADLAQFLNQTAGRGLLFLEMRVGSEQNAYAFFETMNARGLQLAPTDLVKNALFSLLIENDHDIQAATDIWLRIAGSVRGWDFPLFLRHSLSVRQRISGREVLLRAVQRAVPGREQVFPFLSDLEIDADHYRRLSDPHDDLWLEIPGTKESLRVLRMFDVAAWRPLGLAACRHLDTAEIARLLKGILVMTLRFNLVARKAVHQQERSYNLAAMALSGGSVRSSKEVLERLEGTYVSDDEFRAAFSWISFPERSQRRLVTYILLKLEAQRTGKAALDFESGETTLEHILPENPGDDWESFDETNRERFTWRLGNLALLEPKLNRLAANKSMEAKAEIYSQSQFQLTRDAAKLVWTPASIEQRQDQLAKLATAAWRL